MNLQELKKLLKPLIREAVKEVILEEKGIISHIIKESLNASQPLVTPSSVSQVVQENKFALDTPKDIKNKLQETKKKLLESIGRDAYNGVDVFAGTQPLKEHAPVVTAQGSVPSPLAGLDPSDPGVPVDKLFENSQNWAKIAAGNKKKK